MGLIYSQLKRRDYGSEHKIGSFLLSKVEDDMVKRKQNWQMHDTKGDCSGMTVVM